MPSPNEEFQQYEDEYSDRRFNEAVRRWFSLKTLAALSFIALYGIAFNNSPFHVYPSTLGIIVALAICGLLTIGLANWLTSLTVQKITRDGGSGSSDRSMDITMGVVGAAVLAPIVFYWCLGCFTAIVGIPSEQQVIEDTWRDHYFKPYLCAGPMIAGVWYDDNTVCIDAHREHEFPKGSHITLQGKVSPLGMNVEDAVPHW